MPFLGLVCRRRDISWGISKTSPSSGSQTRVYSLCSGSSQLCAPPCLKSDSGPWFPVRGNQDGPRSPLGLPGTGLPRKSSFQILVVGSCAGLLKWFPCMWAESRWARKPLISKIGDSGFWELILSGCTDGDRVGGHCRTFATPAVCFCSSEGLSGNLKCLHFIFSSILSSVRGRFKHANFN